MRNEKGTIHICRLQNPHDQTVSYFISEVHPSARQTSEEISVVAAIQLADPEALLGAAPIDVYQSFIRLNEITGGVVEQLFLKFFTAGLAAREEKVREEKV